MLTVDFVLEPGTEGPLAIVVAGADGAPDLPQLDRAAAERWFQEARRRHFTGKTGEVVELLTESAGVLRRLLIVGCNDGDFAAAGGAIAARWMTGGDATGTVILADGTPESAVQLAKGAALRAWRFDRYRSKISAGEEISLERLEIVAPPEAAAPWATEIALVEGVHFARELVTEPGNALYPETFAKRCEQLRELGVTLTVLEPAEMAELGMNALLGVAQGSARPARLLAMRWNGTGDEQERPVALVGKGVTFDTGGISIKPAEGMEGMKWDMGGAAAVAGAMLTLARRKAKAHVVGVCGLVENMPDGAAQRPGDVVRTMSGQTVEVINTDAEGRLVLCDVLTWVQRTHNPHTIVDLATLTGAIIISLGNEFAGMFTNSDALADDLSTAGKAVGDKVWRLPLDAAYDELIKSDIADMKNLGARAGSSITAAKFLQRFIDEGVDWAHIDIAGTAWSEKDGRLHGKGATGFGVALLDRYVRSLEPSDQ